MSVERCRPFGVALAAVAGVLCGASPAGAQPECCTAAYMEFVLDEPVHSCLDDHAPVSGAMRFWYGALARPRDRPGLRGGRARVRAARPGRLPDASLQRDRHDPADRRLRRHARRDRGRQLQVRASLGLAPRPEPGLRQSAGHPVRAPGHALPGRRLPRQLLRPDPRPRGPASLGELGGHHHLLARGRHDVHQQR